jgi:hypothetical protein
MAIVWSGFAQGNDGNGLRVGVDVTRSGNVFTVKYYYGTEFAYSDSQTLNRTGGSVGGSFSFSNNGGSQVLINTASFTGSPGGSYTFGANITGSYNGANPSVSVTASIPISAPAAPGTPSIARVSDTQHTLSWTRNATGAAPYAGQNILRETFLNGAWGSSQKIAVVSGSATSFSDTTTEARRVYRWRVQAFNSSGSATSGTSANAYTTPPPPTNCEATKSGSDIVVTWSNGPTYGAYETQVERSSGGGAWTLIATRGNGVTSNTDVAPSASLTQQYRVRHRTTSGTVLASAYSTSQTVQLLAPPNAPTNLAPTTIRDAASNVTLAWQHNPVDTTAQTQLQVRHRALGAGTWTEITAVTSSVSSWTLPAGTYTNGTTVEWQVRTRGQHASFGAYSSSATFPTSATPTATVNVPAEGGVVATSALTVQWGYFQAQGSPQAAYRVELRNDLGQTVEVATGVGEVFFRTMATPLPDGSSWSVRVEVTSAAGLTSVVDSNAFTVVYTLPPTPVAAVQWDPETASTGVTVTIPAPSGGQVAAVAVDVFRSVDGQVTWEPVVTGLLYDGSTPVLATDYAPRVAGTTDYQAVAVSALPSRASSAVQTVITPDVSDPVPAPKVWLSGGPQFAQVAHSGGDVAISSDGGVTRVLRQYAGRVSPVEHTGTDEVRSWSISFDVISQVVSGLRTMLRGSPAEQWRDLSYVPGPLLLRVTDGDVYELVSISSISVATAPHRGLARHQVSFTATRVA